MIRLFLFIIFVSSFTMCYSQITAKVSATYTYYAPETMSVEEAKRIALDRAKIQAIADKFGTIVSQSTSTVITNKNGESDTRFFALGGSDVKGEWIETLGEPIYDLKFENHFLVVGCSVTGKIRENVKSKIEIIAKPLRNGTSLKYESLDFRDGDDLYLYFKSSNSVSLVIFLVQHEKCYRLLPYKDSASTSFAIEANVDYILFSKEFTDNREIDEYQVYAESECDVVDIILILSKRDINSLKLNNTLEIPCFTTIPEFYDWLTKLRYKDPNIQTKTIPIKILK